MPIDEAREKRRRVAMRDYTEARIALALREVGHRVSWGAADLTELDVSVLAAELREAFATQPDWERLTDPGAFCDDPDDVVEMCDERAHEIACRIATAAGVELPTMSTNPEEDWK